MSLLCLAPTHCNTLQRTATHCSTPQHTVIHCITLQHTATHCSTRQHTATQIILHSVFAVSCPNILQHAATQLFLHSVFAVSCPSFEAPMVLARTSTFTSGQSFEVFWKRTRFVPLFQEKKAVFDKTGSLERHGRTHSLHSLSCEK